jgi:3'-phosphoadenosine 5'-phosphosulfate sulfotransferase (PAPS reductase)/FAD synthetase
MTIPFESERIMREKKYIASWSGGKDSTFMVDELLRRCEPLDEVIFCDTGMEFPEMYEYIETCKSYWESKYPDLKITLLNWGQKAKDIYSSWADTPFTKGQFEGQIRGFPFHMGMSWCTRELKINPVDNYIKDKYSHVDLYKYIGIAVDEPKRVPENWGNNLYPMVEWGVTEKQAEDILIERGLHNPLYNHFDRTGCWHCPKQSLKSLNILRKNHPNLWTELKGMEDYYTVVDAGVNLFKGIGIQAIEAKLDNKSYDEKDGEEPIGCFCK